MDEPLNLKNVQLDSPSSAVTIDVLGRESISTLDTEREDEECEESVGGQEEHVAAPVTPEQVAPREPSIHTLGKFSLFDTVFCFRTSIERDASNFLKSNHFSFVQIVQNIDALVHSKEMEELLNTSRALAMSAAKTAVHIAALPVTMPLHVVSSTTGMVVGTCAFAIDSVCSTVDKVLQEQYQEHNDKHPVENLIRGVIPVVFGVVGKIKNDIGSTIFELVCPPNLIQDDTDEKEDTIGTPCRRNHRANSRSPDRNRAEQQQYLERLRLDTPSPIKEGYKESDQRTVQSLPPDVSKLLERKDVQESLRSPDVSKFLLRVCDLDINWRNEANAQHEKVYHIDLSKEFYNETLTTKALDALVENGLALLSSCAEAKLDSQAAVGDPIVDWKPEGSTAKLLRKKQKLSTDDWVALMGKEVLVWSGKLRAKDARKADVPVFLSRGMVPISPRGMLQLFWDDSRTKLYNKFSLGRSTSMEMEDDLSPDSKSMRATKVVQSETQVPFTSFSVVMSTLMHARMVDDCYVIVSRSLNPGRAGSHTGSTSSSVEESKNELVWGVNVIRHVPGEPEMTDLISVSQVSSSLVVQFLSHKVGIMAVESCYNAMRSCS